MNAQKPALLQSQFFFFSIRIVMLEAAGRVPQRAPHFLLFDEWFRWDNSRSKAIIFHRSKCWEFSLACMNIHCLVLRMTVAFCSMEKDGSCEIFSDWYSATVWVAAVLLRDVLYIVPYACYIKSSKGFGWIILPKCGCKIGNLKITIDFVVSWIQTFPNSISPI